MGSVDDGEDRISGLPDPLIHHILSFLQMKHVIRTCLLSRRWRNLWRSAPVLDFGYFSGRGSDPATFIGRALAVYEGRKVQRFRASLCRTVATSEIDSWIHFATMHDVEELDMSLFLPWDDYLYKIPLCLLDCGGLRVLRLGRCDLTPHTSFCFPFLTELHLRGVQLADLDTSGCPFLEKIIIQNDHYSDNNNICAPNQRLRFLKISGSRLALEKNYGLTIYAPNLLSIAFGDSLRQFYNIKNLSSLTSATFDLERVTDVEDRYDYDYSKPLVELLKSLSHAKNLKLSLYSIMALGHGGMNNLEMPSLAATCVELETTLTVEQPLGIGLLLRSSSRLETLIINISTSTSIFGEIDYWELLERVLAGGLQLKTVIIHNFLQFICSRWGKPWPSSKIDKIVGRSGHLRLVMLLLGGCKMLEKMIISTTRDIDWSSKSEFLLALKERIMAFPRASPNAEIQVSLHPDLLLP